MEDAEIRGLVERLLKSMLQGRRRRRIEVPPARPGMRVDRPGPGSPHGVYEYDAGTGKWVLRAVDEPWVPEGDGIYLVYFDNTRCPACRLYDKYWFDFASRRGGEARLIIVLCAWFSHECRSTAAAEAFRRHDVHASPTTMILCRKGGETVYLRKHEGILTLEDLVAVYVAARHSCLG